MAATPTPSPLFQGIYPATGLPLVSGKVYTYEAGTSTPATTWADGDKVGANTNPVVLNSAGQAPIFIDGAYKFVVKDALDNLLYELDDILGGTDAFIRPASGVSSLPFDDIDSSNVQSALEELGAKRIKIDDVQLIIDLLETAGALGTTGDIKAGFYSTAPTGWLRCNGAAISRTAYPALFAALVTAPGFTAQTFTITIASPAVVTKTAHGLLTDDRVRLTTTGALPTGLTAGSEYFVKVIDANTFNLAATPGGANINTTGSQSGTHSYTKTWFGLGDGSTTFNLPNDSDVFFCGLVSGTTMGATHPEQIGPHTHTTSTDGNHSHTSPDRSTRYGANGVGSPGPDFAGGDTINGSASLSVNAAGSHSHSVLANSGTKNVPKHIGVPFYIKT